MQMRLITRAMRASTTLLCLLLALPQASAQRPALVLAAGVHAQSVGGISAFGTELEAGVNLYVSPAITLRPEIAWALAPSQGMRDYSVSPNQRAFNVQAGGLPQLLFAGGSIVLSPMQIDSAKWYVFFGVARASGTGNDNWVATKAAFPLHVGVGVRALPGFPRLAFEARARYAPVWFDDPLRYLGVVASWRM